MGKTLADLQSNISISADNAVSGTLNWVEGYTGFSGNPAEQSGNYIALKIDTGGLEGATIVATYNGREVTLDSDQIIIVRHAEGEDTITFTATKEGYTTGVMTLDLSTLTLTPEPAKFSLVCNTPGITFAPSGQMAGGTATFEITATGQVPYDTTTSSNLINMTLTTNTSPTYDQTDDSILVAYLDSEETAHTLYTGSLTWSDNVGTATFNCPITADSITYSPVIAIVVDGTNATRVSQVLDTSALTLQENPVPSVSFTSGTQTVTITGSTTPGTTYNEYTITGVIPYNTTTSQNEFSINIAYTGVWDSNYYKIQALDSSMSVLNETTFTPSNKPSSMTIVPNSRVPSGGIYMRVWKGDTSTSISTVMYNIYLTPNNLTLEPAPVVFDGTVNVNSGRALAQFIPSTYSTSKQVIGTTRYDRTSYLPITLSYTGDWTVDNYHQLKCYDSNGNLFYTQAAAAQLASTIQIQNVTSAMVGTGQYIDLKFYGGPDASSIDILRLSIRLDTSRLEIFDPSKMYFKAGTDTSQSSLSPGIVFSPQAYLDGLTDGVITGETNPNVSTNTFVMYGTQTLGQYEPFVRIASMIAYDTNGQSYNLTPSGSIASSNTDFSGYGVMGTIQFSTQSIQNVSNLDYLIIAVAYKDSSNQEQTITMKYDISSLAILH